MQRVPAGSGGDFAILEERGEGKGFLFEYEISAESSASELDGRRTEVEVVDPGRI